MSYPPYEIPPVTGISKQVGNSPPQPLQPGSADLCTEAYASTILKVFTDLGITSAKLINAATDASLGYQYLNVNPASGNQPWCVAGIPNPGPAGPAVAIQYGPNSINGGGIGNPGKWTGVLDGNPRYVPDPPPPPPLVPPTTNNPADVAGWLTASNVPTVTNEMLMKAIAAVALAVGAKAPQ